MDIGRLQTLVNRAHTIVRTLQSDNENTPAGAAIIIQRTESERDNISVSRVAAIALTVTRLLLRQLQRMFSPSDSESHGSLSRRQGNVLIYTLVEIDRAEK
ncbi:hypothetical protein LSAT2_006951, partial [Lamellibrachia satsuma]